MVGAYSLNGRRTVPGLNPTTAVHLIALHRKIRGTSCGFLQCNSWPRIRQLKRKIKFTTNEAAARS
jgi:hypothetical protein